MRKIKPCLQALLLLGYLCSVLSAGAQEKTAAFEDAILKDFCDSFTHASSRITKENISMEMGLLILPVLTKYKGQIKTEWKLDVNKQEDLQSMAEKVGELAAIKCPAFLQFIKDNKEQLVDDKEEIEAKFYSGKILKLEGQPFAYVLVQNSKGRTDKFYWMEFFDGAEKMNSTSGAYLNKPVTITYKTMEIYQIAGKEYKTIKVITKIEWK